MPKDFTIELDYRDESGELFISEPRRNGSGMTYCDIRSIDDIALAVRDYYRIYI